MEKLNFQIEYERFQTMDQCSSVEQELLKSAKEISKKAHAPYSNFLVGASILLSNGEIYSGNNQENASYPVGICAERTVLSYIHANYPNQTIKKIAIYSPSTKDLITPCGMCRQSLMEYESVQNSPIQILLTKEEMVYKFNSVKSLLPFYFNHQLL